MASDAGTQPCPYCGEAIKPNAIKCRFCGEFLDEDAPQAEERAPRIRRDDPPVASGAVKMIVPVGRSGWSIAASWLGLVALIPFPLIVFVFLIDQGQRSLTQQLMWLAWGINGMFALLAIVTAVGAFLSKKPGRIRAGFGVVAGILSILGYLALVIYMIKTYVG